LSIGCGTGNLERNLRILNICTTITGLDISKESIKRARGLAREEHLKGIKYRVADCNRLSLPRERYDGVFFHGSLHHISDPDALLTMVRDALLPHGLLYIDDYVGPSRDEWKDEHLQHARELYEGVPPELRTVPVNPPLDWNDPSEMIRSSRILPAFFERFEVLHYKPYWGNVLFPLWCALDGEALLREEHQSLVGSFVDAERKLVAANTFEKPLFAVLLGRKKS
jgi:SAM-dependent methyltransferase